LVIVLSYSFHVFLYSTLAHRRAELFFIKSVGLLNTRIFLILPFITTMKSENTNDFGALSPDLELAIKAARRGGLVIAENLTKAGEASVKSDGKGLVTLTDKAAERIIIDTLQAQSAYPIISEETAPDEPSSERSWIVDPLDGTTNFASKLPLFVVSIALFHDQDVVLGVILNPMTGECFYAETGKGAYLNGQPIMVSPKTDPSTTVLFLDYGYQTEHRKRYALVANRFAHRYSVRTIGTTALGLAYLAYGCAGGFICSGDELWDYAAGIVLVEEAGGKVTDWKGHHWDRRNAFILASNGFLHQELGEQIADLQPSET
jgi:myo-inositol-1(or 4)-monophosphatase